MPFGSGKIWMNGTLVDWADARIHIGSHVIHYGSAVFEGARCYNTPRGAACFRLDDHVVRLLNSARIYRMESPLDRTAWAAAIEATIRENGLKACYIRPIMYRGYSALGVNPLPCPVDMAIMVWEWEAYLGPDAQEKGVDVCVSSWNRMAPNTFPALAKSSANYANAVAHQDGGDARRLRRRHRARSRRVHQRGQRAEPVPRAGRHHLHALGHLVHPAGHHPRFDHHDRAEPRLRGPRRDAAARDALPRRRSVLRRYGRRGNAHPLDRQARGRRRRARTGHFGHPPHVLRHPQRGCARHARLAHVGLPRRGPPAAEARRARSRDSARGPEATTRPAHLAASPAPRTVGAGDALTRTAGQPTCM